MPAPEDLALLPGPGDAYKAYGTQSNRPLVRLTCIMGADGFKPGAKA